MVYRENVKKKLPLYYVQIAYTHPEKRTVMAQKAWIRAKDSFKALGVLMKQCGVVPKDVWSQDVLTRDDFDEKELEIE